MPHNALFFGNKVVKIVAALEDSLQTPVDFW